MQSPDSISENVSNSEKAALGSLEPVDNGSLSDQGYEKLRLTLECFELRLQAATQPPADLNEALADLRMAVTGLAEGSGLEQSLQVEIYKQLRLLETDWAFLRMARQPATFAQRRSTMQERLKLLQNYCAHGQTLAAGEGTIAPDQGQM
ncbi:heterocyst frequency control protein PatD [Limnothrix sp. FACHB-708]|uniref:heterocyst frequency control protein PatD n=1 Tax=unclassified Limnothrix TaxID=2632864 RepID=UPI0016831C51|nr:MULTISPECIES: heterocyst frequency control protein PatD [unclassified Limnothrix]MBD2554397.1 heterocyst frequency control protein PatD [Limnothrix sp. FACHB-708]MBD2589381.1 heterocyst frequency control protein PatD [Limnothrix sp. FACHB-406]